MGCISPQTGVPRKRLRSTQALAPPSAAPIYAQRALTLLDAQVRAQPGSAVVRLDRTLRLYQIAGLQAGAGDWPAAQRAFGQAQQQARELLESDPSNAAARAALGAGCAEAQVLLERARRLPGACAAR